MADVERVVEDVESGYVGRRTRRWLGVAALVLLAGFAVDTWLVATRPLLPFDLPVELFVQRVPWGPLAYLMAATNGIAGGYQLLAGAVLVAAVALVDRRAGWLMAIGAIASLADNLIKLSFERRRPSADLVHVIAPASGFSYPSGHAVFYTWASFMLAFAFAPRVPPRVRPLLWLAAAFVIVIACLGRVWIGVHWPSDVLGGFLLGLGWSAFVLWLPERWLPQPSVGWLRRLRST